MRILLDTTSNTLQQPITAIQIPSAIKCIISTITISCLTKSGFHNATVTGANCNLFFPSFSYFPYFTDSFHLPIASLCRPVAGPPAPRVGAMAVLACSLQSLQHLRDYSQSASLRDADCISSSESALKIPVGKLFGPAGLKIFTSGQCSGPKSAGCTQPVPQIP